MRDFLPADMHKRDYVFRTLREVFESFGFEPISTPVLELRSTLLGNYGEEAEKLIFFAQHPQGKEELALRYDLTVPLSRFFAEHENDLPLPFRRYHIAPVYRGERPGRGRYREFYQCDADIVGLKSMSADAECLSLVHSALTRLGFGAFLIKLNNRKLLTALGAYAGVPEAQLSGLYRSVDKTDKIGLEGVAKEMRANGLSEATIGRMMALLSLPTGDNSRLLSQLHITLGGVEGGAEGLRELEEVLNYAAAFGVPSERLQVDLTMVRGLGYYTGPIFETVITEPENLGSVQGGGRYDELIGLFRSQSLPTTGISLGIERLIDLMEQLQLYPASVSKTSTQLLITSFSAELLSETLRLATDLRGQGLACEVFLDERKALGKQLGYAEGKGIPFAAILGPDEVAAGQVKLKDLARREEFTLPRDAVVQEIRQRLAQKD
jgi:histidyl-tRNA synthetase